MRKIKVFILGILIASGTLVSGQQFNFNKAGILASPEIKSPVK